MCRLKLSRLFCLLFALFVFFGSFGLSASAASDNLISSDLTTWTDWSDLQDGAVDITVTTGGSIYRVTSNTDNNSTYLGAIFDHSSLIAGHSYSLSFKMPNLSEINSAFNKDYTQSIFAGHFNDCVVQVGVGFISSSGLLNTIEDLILFKITGDNYTNFFGKSLSASFIAPNYSGTPVVFISISSLTNENHSFYFSNFKLVDNDDNSAELTGIKGFLHSIRWDLVGGICSEDDCPHSSGSNPHLSLTERMSSGFASMFQSIGDKFEEGSTLNTWFTNLANKVGNVDSSISDLGDREEGFFSSLGDKIKGFFSDLGDDLDTWFNGVKQKFEDVGKSITDKFQEIGDNFTEFFDKFKPRVFINFDWITKCWLASSTGQLHYKDTWTHNAAVSDYFEIPAGYSYKLDFTKHQYFKLHVFKYSLDEEFISCTSLNVNTTEFELESGYKYRFQCYGTSDIDFSLITDLSEFCNSYVKVYADEGWINALLYNLKMGIRSLFVPDEAFIATWKEELELLLQERLGIIWDAGDFFIALIQTIGDLLTTTPDDIHYELPEMVIELNGQTYTLWQAQQVDFSFLEKNAFFAMLYKLYKYVLNVFLGIPLLNYAKKEMDATLHN